MTTIRMSGLGATVLATLLAMGCDSGGSTLTTPTSTDTSTSTSTGTGGSGNNSATGGKSGVTTSSTGGATSTTTSTTTGTTTGSCTGTPPTQTVTGNMSITNGYVTAGTLKGYSFTWTSGTGAGTCVVPACDTTGCKPQILTTLCATGVSGADPDYATVVGVGFNFNQASTAAAPVGSVAAPATSITVTAQLGSGTGDQNARIQLVSAATPKENFCVKEGTWVSGTPIPIANFNTKCWDGSGTALTSSVLLESIDITIPSENISPRPFSVCLAGVQFN